MMNKYLSNNSEKIKFIKILSLILLGIFIIFLLMKIFSSVTGSICLIRGFTGIPCPSCGMSRAIKEVINGDITNAFRFHPLFWLPFIVVLLIIFKRKHFKLTFIIAIILLMTVYILRMVFLFPNLEPMKYNEKSIINQINGKLNE